MSLVIFFFGLGLYYLHLIKLLMSIISLGLVFFITKKTLLIIFQENFFW